MATEEYLHRYMEQGKRYEELPARFKLTTSEEDWKRKVCSACCATLLCFPVLRGGGRGHISCSCNVF